MSKISKPVSEVIERAKETSLRDKPDIHGLAYGSRYTREEIPKNVMPEKSNEPSVAYQLIHDELMLDGKAVQNMATFLSTWMEPEADKLNMENLFKNLADVDEYPQVGVLSDRCVNMLAKLFNVGEDEHATGTPCTGSSEAVMLCCLSLKFLWRQKRKEMGKPTDKPNMVFGKNAHVVMEKFCRYFDVEPRMVPVTEEGRYVMTAEDAATFIDENTICVVSILGSTYTGQCEDVKALSDKLDDLQRTKGIDVPIHIDAASGGFVLPFVFPDYVWDFRLPRVKTINVSGHKYGLVYPGIGWAIWRDKKYLPEDLIFHLSYLGGDTKTYNLNFSRSSFQMIAQYYNFIRLGKEGYKMIMDNCIANAQFLSKCIEKSEKFVLRSDSHKQNSVAIPVVTFSLKDEYLSFNEYDVMHVMKEYGWIIPAYKLPPKLQDTLILRVVVREQHSEEILEKLFNNLLEALDRLEKKEQELEQISKKGIPKSLPHADAKHHTFNSVC